MAERQPPTFGFGSLHPADEVLVGYLTASLQDAEGREIDAHLHLCDPCLETLQAISRRINAAAEIATPVPESVAQRVAVHVARPRWWSELGTRFSTFLRLPILVPVAVAAGAVIVLTVNNAVLTSAPRELTRSVPLHQQTLRVTATQTNLRNQPSANADVIATLSHGTLVQLRGEDREWYHVVVPDGREGWVDRRAFE